MAAGFIENVQNCSNTEYIVIQSWRTWFLCFLLHADLYNVYFGLELFLTNNIDVEVFCCWCPLCLARSCLVHLVLLMSSIMLHDVFFLQGDEFFPPTSFHSLQKPLQWCLVPSDILANLTELCHKHTFSLPLFFSSSFSVCKCIFCFFSFLFFLL